MTTGLVVESTFPPFNRANLRLYRLARVLVKKGHEVYFISPSKLPWLVDNTDYEGIKVRQYCGFNQYLYSKLRSVIRAYHLLASVSLIIYLNFKKKLDVIQAWNPLAGLAAIIAGKIIDKPVFLDFTDFYSDIALTDSNRLAVQILKRIEMFILTNAKQIFIVSDIMEKRLLAMGIGQNKIAIVEDGADANWFNPDVATQEIKARYGLTDNNKIIIHHGDIKYPDGVDILFHALKKVLLEIPDARLLVLGGTGSDYFKEIKELGKQLDIDQAIIYTGWVDRLDVPKCLAAADVGAMPMRATLNHQCYLSFKLFEYWASGKPVVTTKLDAICQIVKNGENGLIVNAEDVDGLTRAFTYLLKNPEEAKRMGGNGRKLIEEKFDWDLLMEKEAKFYENFSH